MENASKALIIAGSVLISILVISLLVMFYNNIKGLMNTENNEDIAEQVLEFNKQYDVYYRNNLYGSDVLSIANKVNDYNKRQAEEQGYEKIEMTVTFNSDTQLRELKDNTKLETVIAKGSNWDSKKLQDLIENKTNGWDITISKLSKKDINGYKLNYLSGLRNNELEELFKTEVTKNKNYIKNEIKPQIDLYLSYKTALETLKAKTFKADKFEYDKATGRLTKMTFVEIK